MASLEISDLEEHLRKAQKAATQAREVADWAQKVADDAIKHLSTRRTATMRRVRMTERVSLLWWCQRDVHQQHLILGSQLG